MTQRRVADILLKCGVTATLTNITQAIICRPSLFIRPDMSNCTKHYKIFYLINFLDPSDTLQLEPSFNNIGCFAPGRGFCKHCQCSMRY